MADVDLTKNRRHTKDCLAAQQRRSGQLLWCACPEKDDDD